MQDDKKSESKEYLFPMGLQMNQNEPQEDSQLNSKIARGMGWSGASTATVAVTGVLTNVILARLLEPDHFGLVFMTMIFTGFFQVAGEMGLSAALIQRKEEKLTPSHYHTAFWSGLILGAFFYLSAAFAIAPIAVWFFSEPLLDPLIKVMGVPLLIRPLFTTHKAIMTKQMDFKSISIAEISSIVVASVVTIALALAGWGVWSLALQNIWMALIALVVFFWITTYRPAFLFSRSAFNDIFLFSATVTGNNMVSYATDNLDNLLLGRFAGSHELGIYGMIYMITHTFRSYLMGVINKVMYPVYGKLQDNLEAMKDYYLAVVRYNTLAVFPIMTVFILLAHPLLSIGLGEDWAKGAFPLQMLSLSVMVHALGGTSGSLFRGLGRPGLNFRIFLSKTLIILIPGLGIGIYYFGIDGAAVVILISKVYARLVHHYFLNKLVGVRAKEVFVSFLPALIPFLVTLALGAWALYFVDLQNLFHLILAIMLCAALTIGCTIFSAQKELKTIFRTYLK